MAKAYTAKSPQWWKHLREWKRVFWKRERQAAKDISEPVSGSRKKPKKKRKKYGIEYTYTGVAGSGKWNHILWYQNESRRDMAFEDEEKRQYTFREARKVER